MKAITPWRRTCWTSRYYTSALTLTRFSGRLAAFSLLISLSVAILAGCDTVTLTPAPWRWHIATTFEGAGKMLYLYDVIEQSGVVLTCGSYEVGGNRVGVVFAYTGGAPTVVFTAPYAESHFYSICPAGFSNEGYYFAGVKEENGVNRSYIVKFDGVACTEVAVPTWITDPGFIEVAVDAYGGCWLNSGLGIYYYQNGVWKKHLATDPQRYFDGLACTPKNRVFVCRDPVGASGKVILVSDGGASWAEEPLTLGTANYRLKSVNGLAVGGETLFIVAEVTAAGEHGGWSYGAVITRDDAPPGEGKYDLAFLAPRGPFLYDLTEVALRSGYAGVATGAMTSLAYEGGVWRHEQVPEESRPFDAVCAGRDKYWAISNDAETVPALWENP